MNEIIEMIKEIDKKVIAGVGIAIAVVVILAIVLVIGGNDKMTNGINNTQNNSEQNVDSSEVNKETENVSTTTETESNKNEVTENETTEVELDSETEMDFIEDLENGTSSSDKESNSEQSQIGTTNPGVQDIVGSGNPSDPFLEFVDENNMMTTVKIQPGTTVYYGIYRVGGMNLIIEDANVYVIYEGKRYDASNGKVSFMVEDELASTPVYFEIGNAGSSETAFTLKFTNLTGSSANPEQLSSMGVYNKKLSKGNEAGYYYSYIAERTGAIRFYIDSATKESEMSVTNNNTSINRTFEADALIDTNGKIYIEIPVNQGDLIKIQICAKPDKRWTYPATEITWSGVYIN